MGLDGVDETRALILERGDGLESADLRTARATLREVLC